MPSLTRRDFLKVSAASMALATTACSRPAETIVPYADMPEAALPGVPRYYATAASFVGAAEGLLAESNTGRPTKIEGNAAHPGSAGATSIHAQASVLDLWDPARSKAPRRGGEPATRERFERDLEQALLRLPRGGRGLHLLLGACASPTLQRQLALIEKRFPEAAVHRWDPLHRDAAREGARLAFGRPLEALPRLEEAGAVLSLDARFLEDHPWRLNLARQLARSRAPEPGRMSRLYALESAPSLAGAMADHRYALTVAEIERWLVGFAAQSEPRQRKIFADLRQNRGVVLAGDALAPWAHALVHRLNEELRAPVSYVPPVDSFSGTHAGSIAALARAMHAGEVAILVIVDGNPAYDAPAELGIANAFGRVPFSVHLSPYDDETSARCTWHLPATHFLEHWSDARAFDGTASVVQPLIAPLYGGVSPHELLALLGPLPRKSGHDLVRETWREADWEGSLAKGVLPASAFRPENPKVKSVSIPTLPDSTPLWTVRFVADQSVLDGRFANNAWLQELPRSESKLTWDNAALLSSDAAAELGVRTGDRVRIAAGGASVEAPVWVSEGHAKRSVTLALGYGRARAGPVGNRVGFDAYPLRRADAPWALSRVQIAKVPGRHEFASTQNHARMEGRDLARFALLDEIAALKSKRAPQQSLYQDWQYASYKWSMFIDLNACIGCNACTIACQAENNIPTVGKEQVRNGREMHWIRVDRYFEKKKTVFQPVPCMHCENAPCEYVCPVEASVHDSEGLNVQVYNRCVGTRFCSQNCPYKVRRFNFLDFQKTDESLKAQRNPEVTVRMRGVMEKCTYCLQRITRARITADKEDRRIRDGEVVTACQGACPTRAITFGDLSDANSAVSQARRSPLKYDLLAELNTRPRTAYGARVLNPNPDLDE